MIKEYKVVLVVILIIVGILFFTKKNTDTRSMIPKPSFNNISETLGESVINCQFNVVSDYSFNANEGESNKIEYGAVKQNIPVEMIFSSLNTESPVLKANNGEDPLKVISNTESEITLASSNLFGDVFIYKIYKKQKVATWYKSYDMFGNPFALLSMGYCY